MQAESSVVSSPSGRRLRSLRALAWLNLIVCLGLFVTAISLYTANQPAPGWRKIYDSDAWGVAPFTIVYSIVGLLIVINRPRHLVGWIMCAIGLTAGINTFSTQYAIFGFYTSPPPSFFTWALFWLRNWFWFPLVCLIAFLLLLFPTGSLPSRRWRWPVYGFLLLGGLLIIIDGVGGIGQLIGLANSAQPPTNFSIDLTRRPLVERLFTFVSTLALVFLFISFTAPFFRWRGTDNAIVRQQIKWFVLAGLFTAASIFPGDWIVEQLWTDADSRYLVNNLLGLMAITSIALAVLVAILRYRLFDIDIIIRKTTTYAFLTALLALIYFGSVVVLQRVLSPVTGESTVAVVLSTLLIAALFLPLRRRVQDAIDRRFFRKKYDAEQVLAQFAATARDETDLDALTAELLRVIQETMQPEHVSIWLVPEAPAGFGSKADEAANR
jgi:hypothetical protein